MSPLTKAAVIIPFAIPNILCATTWTTCVWRRGIIVATYAPPVIGIDWAGFLERIKINELMNNKKILSNKIICDKTYPPLRSTGFLAILQSLSYFIVVSTGNWQNLPQVTRVS